MKVDLITLALIAIAGYIGYYIYIQDELVEEQKQIMEEQFNLIETQRAYTFEINKILGINGQIYFYQPKQKEDNPLNDPI
jgi:hypothetical protein